MLVIQLIGVWMVTSLSKEVNAIESKSTITSEDYQIYSTAVDSIYHLIKVKKNERLQEVISSLRMINGYLSIYATKGDFSFLIFTENKKDDLSLTNLHLKLSAIPEIYDLTEVKLVSCSARHDYIEKKKDTSIILILAEEEQKREIIFTLLKNQYIKKCYEALGKYNIVAIINADYFTETDKVITNYLSSVKGLLKVKKLPIFNLFE